ncbi:MAG: SAF domain-containing protein [Clostridiaceae bacterium]|nr:SAF domain-containing protein [Clostridiaceae bacterium]
MRKSRQVLLAILITLSLAGITWLAGRHKADIQYVQVVTAKRDIAAGTQIKAEDLAYIQLPAELFVEQYIRNVDQAVGLWTAGFLNQGELLNSSRLGTYAAGLQYPDAAIGRRLLTIELEPAAANGFWLAAGSLVDLYLVPLSRDNSTDIQVMERVRIMSVLGETSNPDGSVLQDTAGNPLICLDLSSEQARLIASSSGFYEIKLAAINEPQIISNDNAAAVN